MSGQGGQNPAYSREVVTRLQQKLCSCRRERAQPNKLLQTLSTGKFLPTLKSLIHLPGTFHIFAVQVDGRGGNGCMPQVVPDGRQLGTPRQGMGGMGVAHPMWACSAQFFRRGRALLLDDIGDLQEKPLCDAPQPRRRDAARTTLFVTADERCRGFPG